MANTPVVVLDDTLTDIADAIRGKNGSSDTYKPSEMPAAIAAIPSGGGVGIPREVDANGVYREPSSSYTFALPNDATSIGSYALSYAFQHSNHLTSFSAPKLVSIPDGSQQFYYMCVACTSLTSISFPSLTAVGDASNRNNAFGAFSEAFNTCTSLTSVSFPELTNVYASSGFSRAFFSCTSLTSVSFPKLAQIGNATNANSIFYQAFGQDDALASINFPALTTIWGASTFENAFFRCAATSITFPMLSDISHSSATFRTAFAQSPNLVSVSFPALTTSSFGGYTNQFNNMLQGCSGVTVHFPSAIQSTIGSWSDVTAGFGGTNTTVLFDL